MAWINNLSTNRQDAVTLVVAADDNVTAAAVNNNANEAIAALAGKAPLGLTTVNATAIAGPIDVADTSLVVITLNGNVTGLDFDVPVGHSRWSVWLKQDATGSRTVTLDTAIIPLNGYAPFIDPAANAITVLDFESDGTSIIVSTGQRIDWLIWSTPADTAVAAVAGGARWLIDRPCEIVFVQGSLVTAGTTGSQVFDINWANNCDTGNPTTLYTGTPANRPTIATGSRWSGQTLPPAANRKLIPANGVSGVLTVDIDSVHTTPGEGAALQIGLLRS